MSDKKETQGKRPDYQTSLVYKDEQGQERWIELGPSWTGSKGHITTNIPWGRLVQTPQQHLERIRAERREKSQTQEPGKTQEH